MAIPKIAIVGRPNVGKSSIFNWLAGHRVAIVDPTAGVTRDRVTYMVHEGDRYFELVDTGGIGITDSDDLSEDIERQIQVGIEEADLILFVVDGTMGVAHLDEEVAQRLRSIEKPKILCINKCDSTKTDDEAARCYWSSDEVRHVITSDTVRFENVFWNRTSIRSRWATPNIMFPAK